MCNSWEDRLWARLSALIGDRIEAKLHETAGAFWNRGTLLDRLVLLDQLESDTKPVAGQDSDWEAVIDHQLEELTEEAVDTKYVLYTPCVCSDASQSPYGGFLAPVAIECHSSQNAATVGRG